MESGELELRLVFEETTTRNVRAILDHGNQTRKMLRDAEQKLGQLEALIQQQQKTIEDLRQTVIQLQVKLYMNGIQ